MAINDDNDKYVDRSTYLTKNSYFDGNVLVYFLVNLMVTILTSLTLGLAYPALLCFKTRYETNHTVINGCRLTFTGRALEIYGKYIVWLLLSLITLGLYWIFAGVVNILKWKTSHTHIAGAYNKKSKFISGCLSYIGISLITFFVILITLGLGAFWAKCYRLRWEINNQVIDGYILGFNGKGIQFFGKILLWILLTIITIGIYAFWLNISYKRWVTIHTHFGSGQNLDFEKLVPYNQEYL